MRTLFAVGALVALIAGGCEDCPQRIPETVLLKIDESVERLTGSVPSDVSPVDFSIGVAESVYALSNAELRVRCFQTWAERLLARNIDGLGFRGRTEYCSGMYRIFVTSVIFGMHQSDSAPEIVMEMRLRLIDRLKEELNKVRPVRKREHTHFHSSDDESGRYEEWRKCYVTLCRTWRMAVDNLEDHEFDSETKTLPVARRESIQRLVEQCLGRKMRTREIVRVERNVESEECRDVIIRAVEPKSLNPDD